ncbi:proto-oncogene tyrosine-protein kinase ROS-like isoform X2 [Cataglyphis hispanica]|uniref:proto-oncogene tyrosine-protein kinase ROS-like isoform X2 n=2 Tax=Cataglyphis hispanica TaxID=1086592 RepID=UPI00217F8740|nr:proto-oncogene tyrosine-protein kinase ROS-like isoform X2 [Cataglyphis hispanica]
MENGSVATLRLLSGHTYIHIFMQALPQGNFENRPFLLMHSNVMDHKQREHIQKEYSRSGIKIMYIFRKHPSTYISRITTESIDAIDRHDVPSVPGTPMIMKLHNFVYKLYWEPAKTTDRLQIIYRLEGIIIDDNYTHDNIIEKNKHWKLYYNGTNNYWIIPRYMNKKYQFRVQAKNLYGFESNWNQSSVIDLTKSTERILTIQNHLILIMSITSIVIVIYVVLICCVINRFLFNRCQQKQHKNNTDATPALTLAELVTFREEFDKNFVQSNLYVSLQYASDYSAVPEIRQEEITLGHSIGSSTFGYVFKGKMKELEGSGTISVAIKTLRKDSSTREKTILLQEAKLMSQLRHKHILKLLGVCFDTDPPFLVLELMEAGDLLNYLRDSHFILLTDSHALRLQDLLAMCEDVARGCCYLEEMHLVHRDLACRNCLVSAKNREDRVIKIGDFGFAKNIYEDNYYQEERLLPIRWMSPESLLDGIFNSQSDVWSFGVLMWEIMSLGQQPYFTMTNIEVMNYLYEGGRLQKPFNCPLRLYELMLRCWSATNARPSFKVCLENIVTLRSNIDDTIINTTHTGLAAEECSWKNNSSEENRGNQLIYENLNNAKVTTIDVDHIYERLRTTSFNSCLE